MTQTNNEREAFESKFDVSNLKFIDYYVPIDNLNSAQWSLANLRNNQLTAWKARAQSPISQNEQQEAFDKWLKANYPEYPPPLSKVWKAATQASESEINSLKQHVEELEANNSCLVKTNGALVRVNVSLAKESENLTLNIKAQEKLGYELTASNTQLREALGHMVEGNVPEYDINNYKKLLSTTRTPSLAEHDNKAIDRCKNIVADDALAITFQSMGAYRSAIIKQIGELKAEHD